MMRIKIVSSDLSNWYEGLEGVVMEAIRTSGNLYVLKDKVAVEKRHAVLLPSDFKMGDNVECYLYGRGKVMSIDPDDKRFFNRSDI